MFLFFNMVKKKDIEYICNDMIFHFTSCTAFNAKYTKNYEINVTYE